MLNYDFLLCVCTLVCGLVLVSSAYNTFSNSLTFVTSYGVKVSCGKNNSSFKFSKYSGGGNINMIKGRFESEYFVELTGSKFTVYGTKYNKEYYNQYRKGSMYAIPANDLILIATGLDIIAKNSTIVNKFKREYDVMFKEFNVDKFDALFSFAIKGRQGVESINGITGPYINSAECIDDILYLALKAGVAKEYIADLLRAGLSFKDEEGKGTGRYIPLPRKTVVVNGVEETLVFVNKTIHDKYYEMLKGCNIADHLFEIWFDMNAIARYYGETIIDSSKKYVSMKLVLMLRGFVSDRTFQWKSEMDTESEVKEYKYTMVDNTGDRERVTSFITMIKDNVAKVCESYINSELNRDFLITDSEWENIENAAQSSYYNCIMIAKSVYSTFAIAVSREIGELNAEDDADQIDSLTKELNRVRELIAQFCRTISENDDNLIYAVLNASHRRNMITEINKNYCTSFPKCFKEEMMIYANDGSKALVLTEDIVVNNYSDDDLGLRLIVDGVDVANDSVLGNRNINNVGWYLPETNQFKHYHVIEIPQYDYNECVVFIKHSSDVELNNGDILNTMIIDNMAVVAINGEPANAMLNIDVNSNFCIGLANYAPGIEIVETYTSTPFKSRMSDETFITIAKCVIVDAVQDTTVVPQTQTPADVPADVPADEINANEFTSNEDIIIGDEDDADLSGWDLNSF